MTCRMAGRSVLFGVSIAELDRPPQRHCITIRRVRRLAHCLYWLLAAGIRGIGFMSHRFRSAIHLDIRYPHCLRHYNLSLIKFKLLRSALHAQRDGRAPNAEREA